MVHFQKKVQVTPLYLSDNFLPATPTYPPMSTTYFPQELIPGTKGSKINAQNKDEFIDQAQMFVVYLIKINKLLKYKVL